MRLWDDYAELEEDEAPMLLFTMMRHRCLNFLKHKRIVREYADRQISRIRPDRRGGEERLYNLCFSYITLKNGNSIKPSRFVEELLGQRIK